MGKALLIDTSRKHHEELIQIFQECGWSISFAQKGRHALDQLRKGDFNLSIVGHVEDVSAFRLCQEAQDHKVPSALADHGVSRQHANLLKVHGVVKSFEGMSEASIRRFARKLRCNQP
jgi:DNA-binding response OmpR family regulator